MLNYAYSRKNERSENVEQLEKKVVIDVKELYKTIYVMLFLKF